MEVGNTERTRETVMEGGGATGGGWRDTESLLKVKPDSLWVVMEAG